VGDRVNLILFHALIHHFDQVGPEQTYSLSFNKFILIVKHAQTLLPRWDKEYRCLKMPDTQY